MTVSEREIESLTRQIKRLHDEHDARMIPNIPGSYTKAQRRSINHQIDRLCERRDILRRMEKDARRG